MTGEELHKVLAADSERIEKLFEPGAKVTIIVRYPGVQDAAGFCSNDDIIYVEEALRCLRRQQRWSGNPEVVEGKS
jgi:hypothetical protein